jgi:hypothetical protein
VMLKLPFVSVRTVVVKSGVAADMLPLVPAE